MIKYKKQNFVQKMFNWRVPNALPISFLSKENEYTWEAWDKEMKSKFPIRYFLFEIMPDFIFGIKRSLNNKIYEFKSKLFLKQHLLDIRQPKCGYYQYRYGYCDMVEKLIFANFNMLCEFVEKEYKGLDGIKDRIEFLSDKPECVDEIKFLNKVIELYNWWRIDLPKTQLEFDMIPISSETIKEISKKEQEIQLLINDKLKEIIDNRMYFWT